ncbi:MAG: hypothetical protein NXI31_25195 [bacterium]|nr:hypothetical protein [bacterium]
MRRSALLSLAGITVAACHSAPPVFDLLPDPLPRLADDAAIAAAAAPAAGSSLAAGDRLEFQWTSTLGDTPESALCILELERLGLRGAARELDRNEFANLQRTAADLGKELGLPVSLRLDSDNASHTLPSGGHALALTMELPDGDSPRRELVLPAACEGRGFLTARTRIQELLTRVDPAVDLDGLLDLTFSVWAPFVMLASEHDLRRLPGIDLAMTELADTPSMFRSFFQWMFRQPFEIEFPFWEPWPTADRSRWLVPIRLVWGGQVLVQGYAELARPTGLLCATGGIVGLCLHKPSDPSKSLTLRLVRVSKGGEQLIAKR